MIVGFSRYGTGTGYAPVDYLSRMENFDGTLRMLRTPLPKVLEDDPSMLDCSIFSLQMYSLHHKIIEEES
jgi:hypothetical protein